MSHINRTLYLNDIRGTVQYNFNSHNCENAKKRKPWEKLKRDRGKKKKQKKLIFSCGRTFHTNHFHLNKKLKKKNKMFITLENWIVMADLFHCILFYGSCCR